MDPEATSEDDTAESHALHTLIGEARAFFAATPSVRCPYFEGEVTLNADGLNHLLYKPNRQPRNVSEQMLKLKLLKKGVRILRNAGTVQEYRLRLEKVGKPARDGFTKTKHVEYWAFHDIVGEKKRFLMRVIVRRMGDGKHAFWSVMPDGRINRQKLYREGIEDE
jgi:hypothetical protein